PLILSDTCAEHDLNHVKMLAGRGTFVHGCPQCKADEADRETDRVIGDCPECGAEAGGELAIKRVRSGSRLVGCTRYPDCEYSLPLPRRGEMEVTEAICAEHDLPELVVHNGDDPWELGCPICNYLEFSGQRDGGSASGQNNGLTAISGIGKKTAAKLRAAGVESLEDLGAADPEAVADSVDGVSADRIREWQASA
ncbi:MAG: topoisomerase DNA-binding C4 zinc finger domain-containing protein, partial [Halobacteriales archaeon]|nr:topoisomerase DNA-binding C4 zinc finger domain-containing protein [Halobacteriales archaeon]